MLAEGETNARIAQRLVVSEDTVKSHVKHILRKLGVHNRSQAVSRYFQAHAAKLKMPRSRKKDHQFAGCGAPQRRAYAHPGDASPPHLALLGHGGSALSSNTTTSVREPLRASPRPMAGRILREEPLLSIVVPTKNERDNVEALIERLEAVVPTVAMEIIFVDASTDGTAEVVEAAAGRSRREIVLLPQSANRRIGGLGGAVVQGLRAARAPWVCVMDADLQHPPS